VGVWRNGGMDVSGRNPLRTVSRVFVDSPSAVCWEQEQRVSHRRKGLFRVSLSRTRWGEEGGTD